ncbi:MFS transporter [Candidatus Falkowbacteria bacterium]|nr:MFS transporter [Candidatus Falkowbacteria bacterium]
MIYALGALIGFSQSLLTYVAATFFTEKVGSDDVGVYYFIAYVVVLIILINLHKLTRTWGKSNILRLAISGEIFMMGVMLASISPWLSVLALMGYFIFDGLMAVSMDVILESYSRDSSSGRIRGVYLTICNCGFILGPKLSSWLLGKFDFSAIFLLVLFIKSIVLLLVIFGLKQVNNGQPIPRITVPELLSRAWKRKSIIKIYYISCALEFFYGMMVMYSTLYLINSGISWDNVGSILMIMLLPFVFFEYPLGWLADKYWGEKEMLVFFLVWQAIATIGLYFISSTALWVWALAMLLTRVGAAAVQVLRDSYFYKRIDGADVDLIDFFRTAAPVGYIAAAVFSAILLRWLGLREMFLVNGLVVFSAVIPAIRLKDNLSEYERNHSA